jgi:alkyldihydroxyacetonephosphate synthase
LPPPGAGRRRKHWGWGYEDEQPSRAELREAAPGLAAHLGFGESEPEDFVGIEDVELRAPRLADPPASLAGICATDDHARASHAYGKAYRDIVRAFRGRFDHPPDVVAFPRDDAEVAAVLEWAAGVGAAVVPYGGGSSVVGGLEVRERGETGIVSLDLSALREVLEVDTVSRAARIQAGALGPDLEAQLAEHGMTLRHFPQSFQFSSLGGWIATRAGGHFATVYTHIDDLVESVRAITPAGEWESRRLPGSGAGVSPDRMLIGSEGSLGVITEAWMRVQARPVHRASSGVRFDDFAAGAEAVRALSQTRLFPSNCRLLDPDEALLTMAGDGSHALLVLGFESADQPVDASLELALELCADHGGQWDPHREGSAGREGAVGAWREAFLRAPYLRDTFVAMGVLSETFETAITWDRFPDFHRDVMTRVRAAVQDVYGHPGKVSCRFTHVYPDGPAPYFTILAPARRGSELEQWDEVKAAASEAVIDGGGTITHHHAVGRDHRPYYDRQRPDAFAAALRGAKAAVDPAGIMNPGIHVD